jgi:4-hydroxy-3-methylbut-2-en-1-yl diphosphate reductase
MRIILAAPRGFCAGVNMAIESLRRAIRLYGTPIYVYHEIVHNRWVVEEFRRQGVVFVDDLDDVPEGAQLLYSAHGVSPEVRRRAAERNLQTIDATCPLVTKVHREAVRFASRGYRVVLVGHAGHDEVVGTMGEAPEAITLVSSPEEVDRLPFQTTEHIAYLTQTTLSLGDAAAIIGRLRRRYPQIVGPEKEDICYATQNRQEAVGQLARQADVVLVVGSRNSSNSRRLAEIGAASGVPSHLIDGPDDLDPAWFRVPGAPPGEQVVLMTAGASAPEHVVRQCVAWLQERFAARVETRTVCDEQVRFDLPPPLRNDRREQCS